MFVIKTTIKIGKKFMSHRPRVEICLKSRGKSMTFLLLCEFSLRRKRKRVRTENLGRRGRISKRRRGREARLGERAERRKWGAQPGAKKINKLQEPKAKKTARLLLIGTHG